MKLDVSFTDLELAAAKMRGLDAFLSVIRKNKYTYLEGLELAKQYVEENNGVISPSCVEGGVTLTVNGDQAVCFQLYSDIDRFYFES